MCIASPNNYPSTEKSPQEMPMIHIERVVTPTTSAFGSELLSHRRVLQSLLDRSVPKGFVFTCMVAPPSRRLPSPKPDRVTVVEHHRAQGCTSSMKEEQVIKGSVPIFQDLLGGIDLCCNEAFQPSKEMYNSILSLEMRVVW
jgi:hypothetical protein